MRGKVLITIVAVLVLGLGWYAFRPETPFVDRAVDEAAPAVTGPPILAGRFHDAAHAGRGEAAVYEASGVGHRLRFTDFEVDDGPDLVVYLVAAPDAPDTAAVNAAKRLLVAPLKGNVGDQSYDLPTGTDLARFRTVVIWCRRFGVNFAAAPLAAPAP